jgi:Leucine-rich repeat (LRR) protein
LEFLWCHDNQLISLKEIENLSNLKILLYNSNQISQLEGITNFTKLMKNNFVITNINYHFIDCYESNELCELFNKILYSRFLKNFYTSNKHIKKLEQMIVELNGFEKYVLK